MPIPSERTLEMDQNSVNRLKFHKLKVNFSPYETECLGFSKINVLSTLYLLTGCEGRTVKYQAQGFEVRIELAKSVCKKRGLSISLNGMRNPVNK